MWRTLLMIILPLLAVQTSVSVLIVQRYFDLVTVQLSTAVIRDIRYLEERSQDEAEFKNDLRRFGYQPLNQPAASENLFGFADLSGHYILEAFEEAFGGNVYIDSREQRTVYLSVKTYFGWEVIEIARSRLAPVNPHQILLNITAFLILALLIVVLFLRNQVRSIRHLARAAEAFGRGETLYYEPRGADEIRMAGRNFIAMRSRINRQRQQRNLMLSGISHDLRTPLTRFRLGIEMLDDEATKKELLHDVQDMEALITSFLEYASNTATEALEPIELGEFLSDVLQDYPNVTCHDIPKAIVTIRPFLLRRALQNLIGNAERYGDKIELSVNKSAKHIRIMVDDNGPGIAPKDRDNALLAFKRLDQARNQDQGAHAGLGLAITADAVRQQGGELRLEDSPLGGLRAIIQLPLSGKSAER